jgi:hypothetical protein
MADAMFTKRLKGALVGELALMLPDKLTARAELRLHPSADASDIGIQHDGVAESSRRIALEIEHHNDRAQATKNIAKHVAWAGQGSGRRVSLFHVFLLTREAGLSEDDVATLVATGDHFSRQRDTFKFRGLALRLDDGDLVQPAEVAARIGSLVEESLADAMREAALDQPLMVVRVARVPA